MAKKTPAAHNDPLDAELRRLHQAHAALHRERCRAIPRRGVIKPHYYYTLPEVADIFELRDEKHVREELDSRGCRMDSFLRKWGIAGHRLIDALETPLCADDTSESGQPS